MAFRTDEQRVKDVLGTDYDANPEVAPAPSLVPRIRAANLVVARMIECATRKDFTHTDDELKEIETWLAAHFYCVTDKPYGSSSTQGASASYHGQTAMALDATLYGQTAKLLDASGCLESISPSAGGNSRQRASATWLGKRPSEQVDYQDRR